MMTERAAVHNGRELRKPAQPLRVGDRGVRGGSRGQHEELRAGQAGGLQTELNSAAERPGVRGLADEGENARGEFFRDPCQPLSRPREVCAAEVADAARRPRGGIRQPIAQLEERPLLVGAKQPRRQPRVSEEPPEVVSRIGEVMTGCRGAPARVDPAENDAQARGEDVGHRGRHDPDDTVRPVRILVLGGTIFVGRHIVSAALTRGDEVTLFNRGQHGADLFPEVERLRGDRDGDLSALAGRSWDAVVDMSGYFPRVVSASARELADRAEHYTFVSSASAYADFSRPGIDESAPTHELAPDAPEDLSTPEAYGGFKALSERAVEEAFPGRALCVRAGLIVGPHDPTNRFTYWVTRMAEGGEVLAPEPRDQPVQLIDVRDLAEWVIRMAEERRGGVFNATGQETTMERFLTAVRDASGSEAELTWVDERLLADAGVEPFQDLPFWLAPNVDPAWAHFLSLDTSKAARAGLTCRQLAETVRDTLAWARSSAPQGPKDVGVAMQRAGITRERERELLSLWRRQAA